jgi:hypothetical protein
MDVPMVFRAKAPDQHRIQQGFELILNGAAVDRTSMTLFLPARAYAFEQHDRDACPVRIGRQTILSMIGRNRATVFYRGRV